MVQTATFGLGLAFTAGLLSFLSPCVLPLIPSYVTFITGMSVDEVQRARRTALIHALLFILGFTLIFLALGATASALGRVLLAARDWVARAGGVLIIAFGLYLLGVFDSRTLDRERRVHFADKPVGYLGTVLVGIAFGAGWTPCIGPILGSILVYTSTQADLHRGLLLLFVYSLGLGVPFLIAALAIDRFLIAFGRYRGAMVWMSRAGGVLLIVIGLLLVTHYFTWLASYLQALTPSALRSHI
ncbi:MAG TPA: cytochrome c biogenesis protein CcdA [Gemmatimonadaceae bacterium]|nr:cytochrome c biogenesis protein CcdA [Gemmatimonadaceae bacterium]